MMRPQDRGAFILNNILIIKYIFKDSAGLSNIFSSGTAYYLFCSELLLIIRYARRRCASVSNETGFNWTAASSNSEYYQSADKRARHRYSAEIYNSTCCAFDKPAERRVAQLAGMSPTMTKKERDREAAFQDSPSSAPAKRVES